MPRTRRGLGPLLAPLALLLGISLVLGWFLVRQDGERVRMQAEAVLYRALQGIAGQVAAVQEAWARDLEAFGLSLGEKPDTATIRLALLESPLVRSVAVLDMRGELLFPDPGAPSLREGEFLERIAELRRDTWVPVRPEGDEVPLAAHWKRFYWRDGVQLLFWLDLPEGYLILEPEFAALQADLVWRLGSPGQDLMATTDQGLRLYDEQGRLFASWGRLDSRARASTGVADQETETLASLPTSEVEVQAALDGALQGWRFQWTAKVSAVPRDADARPLVALVLGLGLALAALLTFRGLRRINREVREAGQRVSFVNQVSHELKTPLTNIRLYAEMLQDRLAETQAPDSREVHYSEVILREAARLARLIHNVLTFARHRQTAEGEAPPAIHPRSIFPAEVVRKALEGFGPSLEAQDMSLVVTGLDSPVATGEMRLDPDVLEQVLGNLLSNAEKYARIGGWVGVDLAPGTPDGLLLTVSDRGPGLPPGKAAEAFDPFTRFHTRHTDGVGGTGLGLAIVRDLAILHGGGAGYRPHPGGGSSFWVHLRPREIT